MKNVFVRVISFLCVMAMIVCSFAGCSESLEDFDGDLRGRFDFDLTDYVKPGKYKGLSVYVGSDEPTEAQIKAQVLRQMGYYCDYVRLEEGTAELQDIAEVKYQGYYKGEEIAGFTDGRDDGYSMLLGAEMLFEGFDSYVVGMKIGEKKTVSVKLPDPCMEYAFYAGETIEIEMELVGIRDLTFPEYNDAFVQEYGGAHNVDEFESGIITQLKTYKSNHIEDYVLTRIYKMLGENFKIKKIPEKECQELYDSSIKGIKEEAEKKERTYEEHAIKLGYESVAELEADVKKWAEEQTSTLMILYYIGRKEKIALSNAEFDERATVMAQENGLSTPAEYIAFMAYYGYSEYDVREQIWIQMIEEMLLEETTQKND